MWRKSRLVEGAAGRAGAVVALLALASCLAADARAIGLEYRNPEERVLGIDVAALAAGGSSVGRGAFAEAGERYLFAVGGLVTRYARAGLRSGRADLVLSGVSLSSDVGGENLAEVTAFVRAPSNVRIGAGIGFHSARIDGFATSLLATLSVQVIVALERFVVGYAAENVRFAGEPLPGADGTVLVALSGGQIVPVSRLRIDRYGSWSLSASLRFVAGSRGSLSAGYLGATGSLAGSAHVRFGGVAVSAEVSSHPALGVSKALFVGWGER